MDARLQNGLAEWLFGFFSGLLSVALLPATLRFVSRRIVGRLFVEIAAVLAMGLVSGRASRVILRLLKP